MQETETLLRTTYEVRKTKKQKTAFLDFAIARAKETGYEAKIERGAFGVRNLVVGDPHRARVVFGAHYDTCARMPFPNFITPKNMGLYLLYQVAIVLGFLLVSYIVGLAGGLGFGLLLGAEIGAVVAGGLFMLVYGGLLVLLIAGPANPHTQNDNTSGVAMLFRLMAALPEEMRAEAAFVFFDLEEAGLFGSAAFARAHKNEMKHKLLVNFDCVGDGSHVLVVPRRGAKAFIPALEAAFAPASDLSTEVAARGVFYPSDQANFPCGVGVATLRKTRSGFLYMNRIHTKRDTVWKADNLLYLEKAALRLLEEVK